MTLAKEYTTTQQREFTHRKLTEAERPKPLQSNTWWHSSHFTMGDRDDDYSGKVIFKQNNTKRTHQENVVGKRKDDTAIKERSNDINLQAQTHNNSNNSNNNNNKREALGQPPDNRTEIEKLNNHIDSRIDNYISQRVESRVNAHMANNEHLYKQAYSSPHHQENSSSYSEQPVNYDRMATIHTPPQKRHFHASATNNPPQPDLPDSQRDTNVNLQPTFQHVPINESYDFVPDSYHQPNYPHLLQPPSANTTSSRSRPPTPPPRNARSYFVPSPNPVHSRENKNNTDHVQSILHIDDAPAAEKPPSRNGFHHSKADLSSNFMPTSTYSRSLFIPSPTLQSQPQLQPQSTNSRPQSRNSNPNSNPRLYSRSTTPTPVPNTYSAIHGRSSSPNPNPLPNSTPPHSSSNPITHYTSTPYATAQDTLHAFDHSSHASTQPPPPRRKLSMSASFSSSPISHFCLSLSSLKAL